MLFFLIRGIFPTWSVKTDWKGGTVDISEIVQLLANLCTIAGCILPLIMDPLSISIAMSFRISIIRKKKHDQCRHTDRAKDDR